MSWPIPYHTSLKLIIHLTPWRKWNPCHVMHTIRLITKPLFLPIEFHRSKYTYKTNSSKSFSCISHIPCKFTHISLARPRSTMGGDLLLEQSKFNHVLSWSRWNNLTRCAFSLSHYILTWITFKPNYVSHGGKEDQWLGSYTRFCNFSSLG